MSGYSIVTVSDGYKASDKLCQREIELVLLDIKMPGLERFFSSGRHTEEL